MSRPMGQRASGAIQAMPAPAEEPVWGRGDLPDIEGLASAKPTAWAALIDRLGFPIVAFCAVLACCIWLYGQERQERAVVRTAFAEQISTLAKTQREDRDALIRALEKQNQTLEQIKDELRANRRGSKER